MATKAMYQTRFYNKVSIYIVLITFIVFAIVLFINCNSLTDKKERLQAEVTEYTEILEQEQQRTLELQELEKTTTTMAFYTQVARERLGMVFENEIVFKKAD